MKKKLFTLSICTFILALAIFIFSYFMYHHMGPDGVWTNQWNPTPGKPYVTLLFAVWGVNFLFASVMSALSAIILFPTKK